MPRTRILINEVRFLLCEEAEEGGRFDPVAQGSIDRYGYISLRTPQPHGTDSMDEWRSRASEKRTRARDALVELELAEYRSIGDGDSELYAVGQLIDLAQPALNAMPSDWQEVRR